MEKSILSFNALRVHTEHSYVQNTVIEIHNSELGWELAKKLQASGIRFYKNHYTIETREGVVIGYNDGTLSIGIEAYHLKDSKIIELTEPIHILLVI